LTVVAGIIENAEALIEEIVLAGKVLKSDIVIPAFILGGKKIKFKFCVEYRKKNKPITVPNSETELFDKTAVVVVVAIVVTVSVVVADDLFEV
jgi:preprotein translocase subunit SecE